MRKIVIFAFNGDLMCFAHGLFNALDMARKGHEVKLVIEGSATALIKDLMEEKNPFHKFYVEVKQQGLLDGICMACARKKGTLEEARAQGIPLLGEAYGHPAIVDYMDQGYEVITL